MLSTMDVVYNFLQLAVDFVVVFIVLRQRRASSAALAILCAAAVGVLLAIYLSTAMFHSLRLLAFLIFAHGPILLFVVGRALRTSSGRLAALCRWTAVLIVIVAFDAFLIEPHWLEVTHVELATDRLERPLRVAVVADLQTDEVGRYELDALTRVMRSGPDLVLLPGDYLAINDASAHRREVERLRRLLNRVGLEAPLGVYATRGNTERDDWPQIFAGTRVTPIPGTTSLRIGPVQLTALGLRDSFDPELRVERSDRFHIVFGHAPDFALGQVDADLLVAGHTHGGQVRLPFWGPILTLSRVPRAWAAGTTRLAGGRTLVVSRGVGMERGSAPRMRLFCRPQIVVIDLVPAAAADSGRDPLRGLVSRQSTARIPQISRMHR